ncbi:hypothetical protein JMJ77_0005793 [Colletotrichum scovillei]|uniref:Uncharacterized protein n=1 Tax=Colletotrichum scovillei TaxID=1209932 RepID=A0A9P7RHY1_9PEZI|nr:hypothetical protein JMJ77_0005793 [Colletotrichum scovillei]KAG7077053.1 hypothetical protein JMJ76_0014307 [Colletotrichum scovillei]KAG7084135.1 hypothetical protein JMJ78_0009574 [Colletotrichum scovillei]
MAAPTRRFSEVKITEPTVALTMRPRCIPQTGRHTRKTAVYLLVTKRNSCLQNVRLPMTNRHSFNARSALLSTCPKDFQCISGCVPPTPQACNATPLAASHATPRIDEIRSSV